MPAQFCSVRRIRTITIKNNTQTNAINATVKAPLWFVNTLSTTEKILILANFIKWKMGTIVYFSTLEDKVEGFFIFSDTQVHLNRSTYIYIKIKHI
jgi:hypothetical protein